MPFRVVLSKIILYTPKNCRNIHTELLTVMISECETGEKERTLTFYF